MYMYVCDDGSWCVCSMFIVYVDVSRGGLWLLGKW